MKMKSKENATIGNIYRLNGRVPLLKAIPFGLQHVLAMFVIESDTNHHDRSGFRF